MTQNLIPNVVGRNKAAMQALRSGDRNAVVSACQRDAARIDALLEQIARQYDAVSETAAKQRGFAEDIARDPELFAAACREAEKP